jgi:hypothetical protein
MNNRTRGIRVVRWLTAALCALALVTSSPRGASAEEFDPGATFAGETQPLVADRWWGAAGAMLCGGWGALVRYQPAIGMNPYVIAAGLGGCLLAVLDVMTTT